MLNAPLSTYLNIRAEHVIVDDDGAGVVFVVTTMGGSKGAVHVDAWSEMGPEHRHPGFTALSSVRTPYNIWVPLTDNLERAAAIEIARHTCVKHPLRYA